MRRRTAPAVRSIIIADAREISGKTARQIQEHIALKYNHPYEKNDIADALEDLVAVGMVALKGRAYVIAADLVHGIPARSSTSVSGVADSRPPRRTHWS